MPRVYKPKEGAKKRVPIDAEKLRKAVQSILEGKTIKGTAKLFGIPIMTLKRYYRKRQQANDGDTYKLHP